MTSLSPAQEGLRARRIPVSLRSACRIKSPTGCAFVHGRRPSRASAFMRMAAINVLAHLLIGSSSGRRTLGP